MAEKIIRIKLEGDTTNFTTKLTAAFEEISSAAERTNKLLSGQATLDLAKIKTLQDIANGYKKVSDRQKDAYNELSKTIGILNTGIKEGLDEKLAIQKARGYLLNFNNTLQTTREELTKLAALGNAFFGLEKLQRAASFVPVNEYKIPSYQGNITTGFNVGTLSDTERKRTLQRAIEEQELIDKVLAETNRKEQNRLQEIADYEQKIYNRRLESTKQFLLNDQEAFDRANRIRLASMRADAEAAFAYPNSFVQRLSETPRVIPKANLGFSISEKMAAGARIIPLAELQRSEEIQGRINNKIKDQNISLNNQSTVLEDITKKHENIFVHVSRVLISYKILNSLYQGTLQFFRDIPDAGAKLEGLKAGLLGTLGSEETGKSIKFLQDLSLRSGQNLQTLQDSYLQFAPAAKLAGENQENVNEVFRKFSETGTILQLPADKMKSIFVALEQMYTRGVVQSEEVKKQLGNALPASVELAAQAWAEFNHKSSVSVAQFMADMKANKIVTKDFMDFYAEVVRRTFGGPSDAAFKLAQEKLTAQLNRVKTEYQLLDQEIYLNYSNSIAKVVELAATALDFIRKNIQTILDIISVGLVTAIGYVLASGAKLLTQNLLIAGSYALISKEVAGIALMQEGQVVAKAVASYSSLRIIFAGLSTSITNLIGVLARFSWVGMIAGATALTGKILGMSVTMQENEGIIIHWQDKHLQLSTALSTIWKSIKTTITNALKAISDYIKIDFTFNPITFNQGLKNSLNSFGKSIAGIKEVLNSFKSGELGLYDQLFTKSQDITTVFNRGAAKAPTLDLFADLDKQIDKTFTDLGAMEGKTYAKWKKDQEDISKKLSIPGGIPGADTSNLDTNAVTKATGAHAIAREKIRLELQELKNLYDAGEVTMEDYFAKKKKFMLESEKDQANAGLLQKELDAEKYKDLLKFQELADKVNADYLKFTGRSAEAAAKEIELKYRNTTVKLETESTSSNEKTAQLAEKTLTLLSYNKRYETSLITVNSLLDKSNREQTEYKEKLQEIQALTETKYFSEKESVEAIIKARETYLANELAIIAAMEEENRQLGYNSELQEKIDKERKQLRSNLGQPSGALNELTQQADTSGIYALYQQNAQVGAKLKNEQHIEEAQHLIDLNENLDGIEIFALEEREKAKNALINQYEAQNAATREKYAQAGQLNTTNFYRGMFAIGANTFMGLTEAAIKMYGVHSEQAKKAFILYKAMKVGEIIMSTANAVMAAYTASLQMGPPGLVLAPVMAAIAGAMGAVQIATVISQPMPAAHGGLDYVPSEQTYLLNKGERVLSPKQNKDLTGYLQDRKIAANDNNAKAPESKIRIINVVDPSLMRDYLGSSEGEQHVMNIVRSNS